MQTYWLNVTSSDTKSSITSIATAGSGDGTVKSPALVNKGRTNSTISDEEYNLGRTSSVVSSDNDTNVDDGVPDKKSSCQDANVEIET